VEKSYGRRFLASLPKTRLVHDLEDVERVLGDELFGGPRAARRGASGAA
jgi:hypothetical protein